MYDLTAVNEQTSLQPTPAVTVLRERLRKGQSLNTEVADWLQVISQSPTMHLCSLWLMGCTHRSGEKSKSFMRKGY